MRTRVIGTAAIAAAALAVAGCGGDGGDSGSAKAETGGSGMQNMGGGMTAIANTTQSDVKIDLSAMGPERFFVSVGAKQREHKPAPQDDAHMMVTLSDAKSGIRLPDASVTLRLTGPDGKISYDGPLYPMIGRGMGMHYGENVKLGAPGRYKAALVTGSPRIGRHADSEGAWMKPLRVNATFDWDGKSIMGTQG